MSAHKCGNCCSLPADAYPCPMCVDAVVRRSSLAQSSSRSTQRLVIKGHRAELTPMMRVAVDLSRGEQVDYSFGHGTMVCKRCWMNAKGQLDRRAAKGGPGYESVRRVYLLIFSPFELVLTAAALDVSHGARLTRALLRYSSLVRRLCVWLA
jgi:hypothetical protein